MTTIFHSPNYETTAIINPADVVSAIDGFPEICVTTFSRKIIEMFAAKPGVDKIADLYTANGETPVYKIHYQGKAIAFYMSPVGAAACVSCFEEIIAMGAGFVAAYGSCGILDDTISGKIIVPVSAVRDEGTSYHYIPASDEITADEDSIRALRICLTELGYPFAEGKVWTTDAIYRETKDVISRRKREGCIAVEMEYSALLAAARFRKVPFVQFLYGADSLGGEEWEIRDLADHGLSQAEKLMTLAFRCGIQLSV